jgi:hypothetical protein
MRIKKKFKKSGYFWLPSTPDNRIPGTLTIEDGGKIELEVFGVFHETMEAFKSKNELERVIGFIEEDKYVTLGDCRYTNTFLSGGISKSVLYVNRVFSGVEYKEGERVCFNTVIFSIEGIDEWVGITGIKVDHYSESQSTTITYSPPEEISLNLNNGMNLLITFSWNLSESSRIKEAKITQKTYFKLVSVEEKEFIDFITVANKITTLLCFATDIIVCLDYVAATSNSRNQEMSNGNLVPVPIRIYCPSYLYSKDEPKIRWDLMLFRYKYIQDDAERIINNWIDSYDQIELAISTYFSTQMEAQTNLYRKFLPLTQCLEIYHRGVSDGKLKNGNRAITFRGRIKDMIETFKVFFGTEEDVCEIVGKIMDTRDYLTHGEERLKEKAASGKELLFLCFKIEALFQLNLLQILGFTQEQIKSIFDGCYQLQRKLK